MNKSEIIPETTSVPHIDNVLSVLGFENGISDLVKADINSINQAYHDFFAKLEDGEFNETFGVDETPDASTTLDDCPQNIKTTAKTIFARVRLPIGLKKVLGNDLIQDLASHDDTKKFDAFVTHASNPAIGDIDPDILKRLIFEVEDGKGRIWKFPVKILKALPDLPHEAKVYIKDLDHGQYLDRIEKSEDFFLKLFKDSDLKVVTSFLLFGWDIKTNKPCYSEKEFEEVLERFGQNFLIDFVTFAGSPYFSNKADLERLSELVEKLGESNLLLVLKTAGTVGLERLKDLPIFISGIGQDGNMSYRALTEEFITSLLID